MHVGGMMMAARTATEPPPLPQQPTGLTATAISGSVIDLAWTDNATDEDDYEVQWADDSGFTTGLDSAVIAANSVAYSITGLTPAQTIFARVRGRNGTGNGAWSNTATATTTGAAPLAADTTGFLAIGVSPVTMQLWWSESADADIYDVEIDNNSDFSSPIESTTVAAGTLTKVFSTGLGLSITYYARVRGRFTGTGAATAWSVAQQDSYQSGEPSMSAPSGLSIAVTSSTQLTPSWTDNAGGTREQIQLALDSGFTQVLQTVEVVLPVDTYNDFTSLAPNTQYWIRVRAFNHVSDNQSSTFVSGNATTDTDTVPPAPTAHTVTDQQPTQLTHTWTDPTGPLTEVDIELALDAGFSTGLQQDHGVATGTETKTWTSLTEGTPYWVRVRGVNVAGDGAWDTIATATQLAAPTSLAGADHGTFFRLTWTDNSAASDFIEIHRDTGSGFVLLDTIAAAETEYDVADNAGAVYKIRVTASAAFPDSDFSNTFTDPT